MPESVTVGPQGRIVIPAAVRKRLGIRPGSRLAVEVRDGDVILSDMERRVDAALRALWAKYPPEAGSHVVDEFLADRKREAEQEQREYEQWLRS